MSSLLLLLVIYLLGSPDPPLTIDIRRDIVTPKAYVVHKINSPLQIDGQASEDSWKQVSFTTPFIDIEGVKKPKYQTQVKMLWDSQYLYVYAILWEPHIWGNLRQRDTVIFYNNDFEVFLDPSRDTYNYGEIEINALGTVWDLLLDKPYRVGGKANNHWNLDRLQSAIAIHGTLNNPSDQDSCWTVELAIPMMPLIELKDAPKTLPEEGEQWHINFSRVNWDHDIINGRYDRKKQNGNYLPEYNWVWTNQKVINMHEPEKWGRLQFTQHPLGHPVAIQKADDLLIRQIAYALFRRTRFGDHQFLTKTKPGHRQTIQVVYAEQQKLTVQFSKTNFGFEFTLTDPSHGKKYSINEEGRFIFLPTKEK